ncbi:MAG: hypothetical protein WCX63_06895 [Methanoregula sp.]|jgi:maltose-binding protein MalE
MAVPNIHGANKGRTVAEKHETDEWRPISYVMKQIAAKQIPPKHPQMMIAGISAHKRV